MNSFALSFGRGGDSRMVLISNVTSDQPICLLYHDLIGSADRLRDEDGL